MTEVKKTALLPRGDANGLDAIADELQREPRRLRAVIAIVDCKRGTTDYDTLEDALTVRVRRIEVLLRTDLDEAKRLIRRSLEARSDMEVLPLDLEDEISQTFKEMRDPESVTDPDEPDKGGQA